MKIRELAVKEIDRPLAWLARRIRELPGAGRPIRTAQHRFAQQYRPSPDRWIIIDDYDGDLKFKLNRASYMGSAIYWNGFYSLNEIAVLKRLIRPESVFIDVGAHAGEFTLAAAKQATRGRVIAIEPMPEVADLLRTNVALNAFANVTVLELAASDQRGTIELFQGEPPADSDFEDDIVATQFTGCGRNRLAATVRAVPLDELVDELGLERIDVIKIDAEGGETRILRGAERSLRRWRPTLILEVARPLLEAAKTSPGELFDLLSGLDYVSSQITHYRLRETLVTPGRPRYGKLIPLVRGKEPVYSNVLAEPRERARAT